MGAINRNNKDRLFCFIYGREENKKWTLDLFNAINDTSFSDVNDVQIVTIENVLYMGMKNDVAFIVQDILSSYEQQSTFNPNMPIRQMMYISKLYGKIDVKKNKLNIYSDSLIHLPVPKLVVFYNGKKDQEDSYLYLSDAFSASASLIESDITVRVRMININYGKNEVLLSKCKTLQEYSWFINKIRINSSKMEIYEAVNEALEDMPESYCIKPFLVEHKAEVTDMCITEYNEAETLAAIGEEKFIEGKAEGKAEGKELDIGIIEGFKAEGKISEDVAAELIEKIRSN